MTPKKSASPRIASAVVLVRGNGSSLEVYLAERAPQLRFFGGYHAFIGGVREPVDGPDVDGDDSLPMRRCAVRELFEETGLLVDPDLAAATSADTRRAVRERLLDRESDGSAWGDLLPAGRDVRGIREFCRITTPPFAPVRYATAFFVAELGPDQEPEIVEGELIRGAWWRAQHALDAWHRGEIEIVPPALILLECLLCDDVDGFRRAAETRAAGYASGQLHHVRFSPGILLAPLATPTIPPATTTNCLLVGTDSIWIIDPASPDPAEQERLFALCDERLAAGATIAGVLSTHHHPDHTGAIAAVCARYGVAVRGHAKTLERLPPGCVLGDPLADGDTIDLGTAPDGTTGWHLRAIHTPGHDRGHLCFYENRYRALVAGDMVSTISTIVIDPPEGHLATYLASLAKLDELDIGTLYPAHGPAMLNGNRILKRYLEHRAEREEQLVAALGGGAATPRELVPLVYADTDSRVYPLAERSLVAGLEKLRDEGRASCDGDGVWRGV